MPVSDVGSKSPAEDAAVVQLKSEADDANRGEGDGKLKREYFGGGERGGNVGKEETVLELGEEWEVEKGAVDVGELKGSDGVVECGVEKGDEKKMERVLGEEMTDMEMIVHPERDNDSQEKEELAMVIDPKRVNGSEGVVVEREVAVGKDLNGGGEDSSEEGAKDGNLEEEVWKEESLGGKPKGKSAFDDGLDEDCEKNGEESTSGTGEVWGKQENGGEKVEEKLVPSDGLEEKYEGFEEKEDDVDGWGSDGDSRKEESSLIWDEMRRLVECEKQMVRDFEGRGNGGEERGRGGEAGWDVKEQDIGRSIEMGCDAKIDPPKATRSNCAYFIMIGKCISGERCKFNHSSSSKGNQYNGQTDCKLKTSINAKEENAKMNDICSIKGNAECNCNSETPERTVCREQWMKNSQERELNYGSLSSSDQPDCLYFVNDGKCTLGDRCRFKHVKKQMYCIKSTKKEVEVEETRSEKGAGNNGSVCFNDICKDIVKDSCWETADEDCKVEYDKKEWVRDESWSENEGEKTNSHYPQRPHVVDCAFYLKTGSCAYGQNCKFNHPCNRRSNQASFNNGSKKQMMDTGGNWDLEFDQKRKDDHQKEMYENNGWEDGDEKLISGHKKVFWENDRRDLSCHYLNASYSNGAKNLLKKNNGAKKQMMDTGGKWDLEFDQKRKDDHYKKMHENNGWEDGEEKLISGHKKVFWENDQRDFRKEAESWSSYGYPKRPNEPDCAYYLHTGECAYGSKCKFNHPITRIHTQHTYPNNGATTQMVDIGRRHDHRVSRKAMKWNDWKDVSEQQTMDGCEFWDNDQRGRWTEVEGWSSHELPQRPNEPDCAYYLNTGKCAYGSNCKFNHPYLKKQNQCNSAPSGSRNNYHNGRSKVCQEKGEAELMHLNFLGLPLRPGMKECPYYMQNGTCKFSVNCCFHHPESNTAYDDEYMVHNIRSPSWNDYQGSTSAPGQRFKQSNRSNFNRNRHPSKCQEDYLLSPIGLPLRPGRSVCTYYSRMGVCKFGPACEYDHPCDRISSSQGY